MEHTKNQLESKRINSTQCKPDLWCTVTWLRTQWVSNFLLSFGIVFLAGEGTWPHLKVILTSGLECHLYFIMIVHLEHAVIRDQLWTFFKYGHTKSGIKEGPCLDNTLMWCSVSWLQFYSKRKSIASRHLLFSLWQNPCFLVRLELWRWSQGDLLLIRLRKELKGLSKC